MPAKITASTLFETLQALLLLGLVGWLVAPASVPDPFGFGPQLSWALVAIGVSACLCLPAAAWGHALSTPVDWLVAACLAIVAVTGITGVSPWETLAASVVLVSQIGLFYGVAMQVRRTEWLGPALIVLVVAGAALVELMAFGFHVEFGLTGRPKEYPIPPGWSGYPELGALAVLQFGLLVGALTCARRLLPAMALAAVLVIAGAEILFLYSRTAWLASAALLPLAILLGRRRVRRAALIGFGILGVAGWLAFTSPTIRFLVRNLVTGRLDRPVDVPVIDVASPSSRMKLWSETIEMIRDSPVVGVGLGNFRPVFETEYNPELNTDQRRGVHAHNLWLQRTAELGIAGGLCFALLWGRILWVAGRAAHRRQTAVTAGAFLAIAGATISNTTDLVPGGVAGLRVFLLTWVIFGLAVGTGLRASRPASDERALEALAEGQV